MKIALTNIEKIIEVCTKKEIDLIIYMGQFQDGYGYVRGIDYKDTIEAINICKSTFYKLLYSLEAKGIIEIENINEHGFWSVKFIDNEFKNSDDYKKGYLNLNYEVLHSEAFKRMTKGEKVIVINLILIKGFAKNKIRITPYKLAEWTGRSMRSVAKFIDTLRRVFHVIKKGNLLLVDCLTGFDPRDESEYKTHNSQLIKYILKKHKCQADLKDISDVCVLFRNCDKRHIEKHNKPCERGAFVSVLSDVVCNFGTIIPPYINNLLCKKGLLAEQL